MKNEKIIATLEKYIDTLSNDERMRAYEIGELMRELKQELKEETLKEKRGNTYLKRSKFVSKLLSKCVREDFRQAFSQIIKGEVMQCCIIDGYYGFAFREPLELPTSEGDGFSMDRVVPNYKHFDIVDYDAADIRAALKLHKAKKAEEKDKKKKKESCVIKIKEKYYDAQFICNIIDVLSDNAVFYQDDRWYGVDVFESECGIAIICPIKPADKE